MRHQLRKPEGRKYYNLTFTDTVTGERVKKSTGCELKGDAEAWTHRFIKTYEMGSQGSAVNNRTTVGQLVENFLEAQKVRLPEQYAKSLAVWRIRMADKFSHIVASEMTGRDTLNYINWCVGVDHPGWGKVRSIRTTRGQQSPSEAPLAKATANRDIALLQGAYTHARTVDNFMYRPNFSRHDESDNVREGFLYQWEFDAVSRVLSDLGPEYLWLRGFLETAYEIGNRKGELQKLKVHQIHKFKPLLIVERLQAKSGKQRLLGLTQDTYQLLKACCAGKGPNDYVFTRRVYSLKLRCWGEFPVGNFRKTWRNIRRLAGIERNILIHDFRRSTVNNMIQAGADRDEIRMYTGHSVNGMHAMISRYHVVHEKNILEVSRKNEARKHKEQKEALELSPNRTHEADSDTEVIDFKAIN